MAASLQAFSRGRFIFGYEAGWLEEPNPPFAGEPAALVDHLHELVDLGFDLFQMVFVGFPDTGDIRLFVDEVLPAFS